tara:strand:+ start:3792 stop:4550 length:759 start_codon:yes stop_codon:yes gene_type:complete
MSLEEIYYNFLILWASIAVVVFFSLFYRNAPYGRFINSSFKLTLSSRVGWVIMESPTIIIIIFFLVWFYERLGLIEIILSLIWLSHYIHRTLIWPFRAKLKGKRMTGSVMLMALIFNLVNITLQCSWIFALSNYDQQWLMSPIFLIGLTLFYVGMFINIKSDNILMKLREDKGTGYHVPNGFLYRYLSCPNYFGEIIEWMGWALLTMSPAGLVFFIWTFANLVPRARSNHKWSTSNIPEYPKNRKAIFPFIY